MTFFTKKIDDREYQKNIFETCKSGNTLVVLPTGLGKTIISAMLADYRLEKYPNSKVLFLAPTKPLINQHMKTFSNIMDIKIGTASGSVSSKKRSEMYLENQLIFATPQTIENDIKNEVIDFSSFSLLIVDEAHHTVGNYSYVKIAKDYTTGSAHPLILGLTASPASEREKIRTICNNLGITNVEIRSEEDPDVSPYIENKEVEVITVNMPLEIADLSIKVKEMINSAILELQSSGLLKNVQQSRINRVTILLLQKSLQTQMFSGRRSFYLIRGIILTSKLMKLYHAYGLVSTQSLSAFFNFLVKIEKGKAKTDKELVSDPKFLQIKEKTEDLLKKGIEHPKLEQLVQLLKNNFSEDKKAIIFAQYRDTVDAIYSRISSMENIRPVRFIGQGKGGLSQKEQVNIISDFESGVYNVLVSTSVSEEGMSIRGVDIAVFYETIPSAIRNIQRRGRVGRFAAGKVFILITKGTNDESYYWLSKRREKSMKKIIKNIQENPENIKQDGTLNPFA
ncbi:MAG: DEAD/DEAH box helicase domain protein [Candidatus Parvarchaeum acidophilus ARMAN-5]|uniref:DEAD/DEAH box helicase domain protein n=1 Tax=Candidatus Parvarchaeum acidophilus ARMAN-5 TaxID=662762 RepID=D6GV07_PARA5|nr:MAG: DEAD/DEAH box helicase domain protein [Candidatus Parvarchaeum acidophilus ARMAN-5]